jgi:hypothetical protein
MQQLEQTRKLSDLRIATPEGLNVLHAELNRQRTTKQDYIVPSEKLKVIPRQDDIVLNLDQTGTFGITSTAHRQLASKLEIPQVYYDRMLSTTPELLSQNINHWIGEGKPRLIRTLDGKARAILSDRYKIIDNDDVFMLSIREMSESHMDFHKADLTENHMYIKAVSTTTQAEIRKGDVVQAGIVIRNSETGLSSFAVEPFILRLACINGLIIPDAGLSKAHLGRKNFEGRYSRETQELNALASISEMRDIIRSTLDGKTFDDTVKALTAAAETVLEKPIQVISNIGSHLGFTEAEQESILTKFIAQSDPTKYVCSMP